MNIKVRPAADQQAGADVRPEQAEKILMANQTVDLETLPDDDPRWDLPAILLLADGREAHLEGCSVRVVWALWPIAWRDNVLFGGEIDPQEVRGIGFKSPRGAKATCCR